MNDSSKGFVAVLGASLVWGGLAMYWRQLQSVPAYEILACRMASSFLVLLPLVMAGHRWKGILDSLRDRGVLLRLCCSTLLIAMNWFAYIWAVNDGRILETSLGYYMTPLINVALGCVFLGERASNMQKIAFVVAGGGVVFALVNFGAFPWVGFFLASSFALYGFLRKTVKMEAFPGLFVETALLAPVAFGWLFWRAWEGVGFWSAPSWREGLLLLGTGVVTAFPLGLFAYGARRIRLVTLGFLQFLSPTGSFLVGVFLYNEPVTTASWVTFSAIWSALLLQTWDGTRKYHAASARTALHKQ